MINTDYITKILEINKIDQARALIEDVFRKNIQLCGESTNEYDKLAKNHMIKFRNNVRLCGTSSMTAYDKLVKKHVLEWLLSKIDENETFINVISVYLEAMEKTTLVGMSKRNVWPLFCETVLCTMSICNDYIMLEKLFKVSLDNDLPITKKEIINMIHHEYNNVDTLSYARRKYLNIVAEKYSDQITSECNNEIVDMMTQRFVPHVFQLLLAGETYSEKDPSHKCIESYLNHVDNDELCEEHFSNINFEERDLYLACNYKKINMIKMILEQKIIPTTNCFKALFDRKIFDKNTMTQIVDLFTHYNYDFTGNDIELLNKNRISINNERNMHVN